MEFNEFLNKASEGYNLIPIIKEIESYDKEAIDIYSNHFDKKKSFFFESLEGDKNWSRYTIIGCSSGDFIEIYGNEIHKFSHYSHEEIMELVEGKGFWSDPIYSQIDPLDPKSYVLAFIEDANRHGVDLSFVDPNKITVNFREEGQAGLSHRMCIDDDRVVISYNQAFWDNASYYDLTNSRITVMWHELGHDLLNSSHPVEGDLNQIMNQSLVKQGKPKWDDSDPMFSFRRMVDDMFSGTGLYYTCNNGSTNYSSN